MTFTVLIVEDKPELRSMLRRLLERRRYQILEAENGASAVQIAALHRPCYILMDVALPDFDGIEAARQIRTQPRCGDIPILFLTAHNTRENARRMAEIGGTDWMIKPFDIDELLTKISHCLTPPA